MKQMTFSASIFFAVAASAASASPVTIDYGLDLPQYAPAGQQSFSTPSLDFGGVTVDGSADVFAFESNGLGITGGLFNNAVDGTEWIRFSFNGGAAIDVSYFVAASGNTNGDGIAGERVLEAFGTDGGSLGTCHIPYDYMAVS